MPQDPVKSEAFRDAMRHVPAGVTVVTVKSGDQIHGLTVSSFVSVSPEPPRHSPPLFPEHSRKWMRETDGIRFRSSTVKTSGRSTMPWMVKVCVAGSISGTPP